MVAIATIWFELQSLRFHLSRNQLHFNILNHFHQIYQMGILNIWNVFNMLLFVFFLSISFHGNVNYNLIIEILVSWCSLVLDIPVFNSQIYIFTDFILRREVCLQLNVKFTIYHFVAIATIWFEFKAEHFHFWRRPILSYCHMNFQEKILQGIFWSFVNLALWTILSHMITILMPGPRPSELWEIDGLFDASVQSYLPTDYLSTG